jgi:hypothetical protein
MVKGSGVPRKLLRGGGPFSRPRKVDDHFLRNYHLSICRPFFGRTTTRQLDDLFFFAHRSIPMPPPSSLRLSNSQRGGHLPVHLFSCLLQAVKNNIPSAKGGAMDPWPPVGKPLVKGQGLLSIVGLLPSSPRFKFFPLVQKFIYKIQMLAYVVKSTVKLLRTVAVYFSHLIIVEFGNLKNLENLKRYSGLYRITS